MGPVGSVWWRVAWARCWWPGCGLKNSVVVACMTEPVPRVKRRAYSLATLRALIRLIAATPPRLVAPEHCG
jgi:hypothetical protein